ncbi:MAG: HAD family hydrolase [Eubacteriales bacterium]|nr:HAD family hydrolase [Eubacteriales bacterium]
MEIKGILFDKDGTLIDFYEVWGTAAEAVEKRLAKRYGFEGQKEIRSLMQDALGIEEDGKILSEGALAYKSYRDIAKDMWEKMHLCTALPDAENLAQVLREYFYEEVNEKRKTYPVFTNLPRMMEALVEKKIHIGVATTDEEMATKDCLRRLGIDSYISFYGTAGNEMPEKPNGKLVHMAAEAWQVKPEEIAVVGDTPNDMRFAHNAGAVAIGVLSGVGSLDDLQEDADMILASVDGLPQLLEKISPAS